MEYHIQQHHTPEGIARKFHSETQLAKFFDSNHVSYDRDWVNRLQFKTCQNIEGNCMSARPDFFLPEFSAKLKCVLLVGNDEFAHRQYACEFQRVWNIAQALEQTPEFRGVPIVYVRFNPHHFQINGKLENVPLETAHQRLLGHLQTLSPAAIRPNVNLIYMQYDQKDGLLQVFADASDDTSSSLGSTDYRQVFASCLLDIW